MGVSVRAGSVFCSLLLFSSCQHQPQLAGLAYRLTSGDPTVLQPPAAPQGIIKVNNARRTEAIGNCNFSSPFIALEWKGKTALFRMAKPGEFAANGNRTYADAAQQMNAFRDALDHGVERGCYTPEERRRLLSAATEHFALAPHTTFEILYGGYSQSGYLDIEPEFRLETISPLQTGFETAIYGVEKGRLHLFTVNGQPATSAVSQEWLNFADIPLHYRLIFLIAKSAADHDAILLGARTREALEKATLKTEGQPEEACAVSQADYACALVPARSALNPQYRVTANGSPMFVTLGSTVREAIWPRGPRMTEAPATLRVSRNYEGHPIPVIFDGPDILSLVLLPGDELTW